jgi:tetratricopeptide (TPR) repeat protein
MRKGLFFRVFCFVALFWVMGNGLFSLDAKSASEINQYKLAILADPTNAMYHNLLAYTYEDNGMFMEALAEYQTAVKLEPDNPVYQNNLGMLYLRIGNPIKAVQHLKIAVNLSPDEPNFLVNYARALADKGEFKRAFHYLVLAYKKDKTFPEIKPVKKELVLKLKQRAELIYKSRILQKRFSDGERELTDLLSISQKFKLKKLALFIQSKIKSVKEALKKEIQKELQHRLQIKKAREAKFWKYVYLTAGVLLFLIIVFIVYMFLNTPPRKIKRAYKKGNYEIVILEFEKNPTLKKKPEIVKMYYEALPYSPNSFGKPAFG